MNRRELVEEALTHSVIGAFFDVYNTLGFGFLERLYANAQELHKAAVRQVHNYLRATNLEIGLPLHFGPEPKFFRVFVPNGSKTGGFHRS